MEYITEMIGGAAWAFSLALMLMAIVLVANAWFGGASQWSWMGALVIIALFIFVPHGITLMELKFSSERSSARRDKTGSVPSGFPAWALASLAVRYDLGQQGRA